MLIKDVKHIRIFGKPKFIIVSKMKYLYYMNNLSTKNKRYDLGVWKIKYKN